MVLCRAYRSNTLKHSSVYEAFLPFFSPMLLFVLSTLWVILSPSDILELQPRIFYLMVGTAFSNVTVSTTHAHTHTRAYTHTTLCSLVCIKSSYRQRTSCVVCVCVQSLTHCIYPITTLRSAVNNSHDISLFLFLRLSLILFHARRTSRLKCRIY